MRYIQEAIENGTLHESLKSRTFRYMPLTDIYDESPNAEVRHCIAFKNDQKKWTLVGGSEGPFEYPSAKEARAEIKAFNKWKTQGDSE